MEWESSVATRPIVGGSVRPTAAAFVLTFTVIGITACTDTKELQARLDKAESQVEKLEKRMSDGETANRMTSFQLMNLEFNETNGTETEFDPADRSFSVVRTNNGHFPVSIENILSYGDGQRITMRIGNPYNVTFNGISMTVRYGPRRPTFDRTKGFNAAEYAAQTAADQAWEKSVQKKEVQLTDRLHPGRWNAVSIVVAPAKPEELGFFGVRISTNQISLIR